MDLKSDSIVQNSYIIDQTSYWLQYSVETFERCVGTIALAPQRSNSNASIQHLIGSLPLIEHITGISKIVLHQIPHLKSTVSTRFVWKKSRKGVTKVGSVEENFRFCVLSKKSSFFTFMFKRLIHKLNCFYFLKRMVISAQVKAETLRS